MKECSTFKEMFVGYMFDDIQDEAKQNLEKHLDQCPDCEAELTEMMHTLELMGKRVRTEPPEEYWDTYWARLSERMEKELAPRTQVKVGIWEKIRVLLPPIPRPAYSLAAVAAALVLGILIGRFIITTGGVKDMPVAQRPQYQEGGMDAQTVDYRAEKYLEKSKIFLLGFVNTNGEIKESGYDFDRQRDLSQGLIQEASYLKENLTDHSQQRLKTLIEDLETILIEIANLEEEEDLPDIELIRDGIDRKGILLKINVHQMGDGLDRENHEPKTKKDKTLI